MKLIYNPNQEELLNLLEDSLMDTLASHYGEPILLLTSGESSLEILNSVDDEILGDHITVAVLDEKAYSHPDINNFLQLQKTVFYKQATNKGCKFFDTSLNKRSPKEVALKFEYELKKWRKKFPEGKIITILGLGPDGHTSGIMPFPENEILFKNAFCSDAWVRFYNAGDKSDYPLRITTTITFLKKEIDYAFVYIKGEPKKYALERIIAKDGDLYTTPARVFGEMKDISLYTDIKV